MTVQETIQAMKFYKQKLYNGIFNQFIKAFDVAIQALEEVEQYRAIGLTPEQIETMQGHNVALINDLGEYQSLGTVEELKEAREKQVAKKPIETEHFNCLNYECPICEGGLYHEQQYCDECGQALKWGEEDD